MTITSELPGTIEPEETILIDHNSCPLYAQELFEMHLGKKQWESRELSLSAQNQAALCKELADLLQL